MRVFLAAVLCMMTAGMALAQLPDKDNGLASQWVRMPKDARMSYMVGAMAGLHAVADTQPSLGQVGSPKLADVLDAMDSLALDKAYAMLPLMAVAGAALDKARGRDPEGALAVGRAMIASAPGQAQPAQPAAKPQGTVVPGQGRRTPFNH